MRQSNGFKRPPSNNLQRGINTPLMVVKTQKQEEIEKEVKQNLFHLPGEEELEQEVDEVRKAQELRDQWQNIRKEEEIQQAIITKKKLEKIENEQLRLADKLEELINAPKLDDQEEKYKLIALRRRIEQDYRDDQKKIEEQFLVNKEQELEKIVRKKIEMENLIEYKKKMNEEMRKLQLELEAVEEIKDKKDLSSKKLLDKALNRMGGVELQNNDFMTEKDKILLADALLDDKLAGEKQKELILMEVQSKVNQQRSKANMETQNKIKQLNELRFTISEKQEKILLEKAIYGEIVKKGPEFLTDIELGLAPPLEYIKKNVRIDEDKLDQYRNNTGINDITKKGKKFLQETENRIHQLKVSAKLDQIEDQPYNNEIKPYLNSCNPETVFIARGIVDIIIDKALRIIIEKENKLAQIRSTFQQIDEKSKNYKITQNNLIGREFVHQMAEQIFQETMLKVEREAANEIYQVNFLAQSIALDIIIKSIKQERNTKNSINKIRQLYLELRDGLTKRKDREIKFNFKTQQQIDWKRVKKGKKNFNQAVIQKQVRDQKRGKAADPEKEEEDNQFEQEDDQDLDVIILYPNKDCLEALGQEKIKDYEIQYWELITLRYVNFRDHTSQLKISVTYISLSPFKEYVLVGMSNGEVYLYDTLSSPAVAAAIIPSFNKQPIIDIQFGMDNIGHLAILDASGQLRFCYNAYNLKQNISKDSLKSIEKLPESFQPMFYIEYMTLNYQLLIRNKSTKDDAQNLKLTTCVFHPSLSFSCLQPNLFFGAQNGTILKFNSNRDLFNGKQYRYPVHNILNSKTVPNEDQPFPEEMKNYLDIQLNDAGTYEGKRPHIFREFFQGHKAPIIYITFLTYPENILTIDKEGYVFNWEYTENFFHLRSKTFKPRIKYKVDLTQVSFGPLSNQKDVLQFFPPVGQKLEALQLRKLAEAKYQEYFNKEDNEMKILYEKPQPNGNSELMICYHDLPAEEETEFFELLFVNHGMTIQFVLFKLEQKKMIQGFKQEYKAQSVEGFVSKVKTSLVNQYLYLQIIKPHSVSKDLIKLEFVGLNTNGFRLKKLRAELEGPLADNYEFEVIDNYYPFMVSYIFINMPQGIVIISLATGSILKVSLQTFINQPFKVIREHFDIIKNSFPAKILVPNGIAIIENEQCFLSYQASNGVWRFDIVDENDDYEKKLVYENGRIEYEKLFRQ